MWLFDGSTNRANPSPYKTSALLALSAILLFLKEESRMDCGRERERDLDSVVVTIDLLVVLGVVVVLNIKNRGI